MFAQTLLVSEATSTFVSQRKELKGCFALTQYPVHFLSSLSFSHPLHFISLLFLPSFFPHTFFSLFSFFFLFISIHFFFTHFIPSHIVLLIVHYSLLLSFPSFPFPVSSSHLIRSFEILSTYIFLPTSIPYVTFFLHSFFYSPFPFLCTFLPTFSFSFTPFPHTVHFYSRLTHPTSPAYVGLCSHWSGIQWLCR